MSQVHMHALAQLSKNKRGKKQGTPHCQNVADKTNIMYLIGITFSFNKKSLASVTTLKL